MLELSLRRRFKSETSEDISQANMNSTQHASQAGAPESLEAIQVIADNLTFSDGMLPSRMATVGLVSKALSERVFTLKVDDPISAAILNNGDFIMTNDHPSFEDWYTCLTENGRLVFNAKNFMSEYGRPLALVSMQERLYDIYFSESSIRGWLIPSDGEKRRVNPIASDMFRRMPRTLDMTDLASAVTNLGDSQNKTSLGLPDFVAGKTAVVEDLGKEGTGKDAVADKSEKEQTGTQIMHPSGYLDSLEPYALQLREYLERLERLEAAKKK